jgi:hypothetical protein
MINICPKKPWSDVEDTPTQRLRPRTFILNLAAGRKVVVPSTFSGKTHPNICFLGSRIAKKFYVINESINISEENDINVIKCPKVFQVQRLLITASPPSDRISYAPAVWVTRCDGKWKVDP